MNPSVFLQKEGRTAAATKITLCGHVRIFMKRIISCVLSLVLLVSISATPILAATKATQEPLKITERADRSNEKYTLEDLAAMRLAVYGILEEKFRSKQEETNAPISRPEAVKLLYRTFSSKDSTVYEKAPFRDVSEAYQHYIDWAYAKGVTRGTTADTFGTDNISQRDFLIMLLRAAGYKDKFTRVNVFDFSKKLGLNPAGIRANFTAGDAALYLQDAIKLFKIAHTVQGDRIPYPRYVSLKPTSINDIKQLLKAAILFVPEFCDIQTNESFTKEDMLAAYRLYRDYQHQWEVSTYKDDLWYASYLKSNWRHSMSVKTGVQLYQDRERDASKAFCDYQMELKGLNQSGEISQDEYKFRRDMAEAEAFFSGEYLQIQLTYAEAWKLIRNTDDAFVLLEDGSISASADKFYQQYRKALSKNATARQKVLTAKSVICAEASYDYGENDAVKSKQDTSRPNAHSILGFLENRTVVCDRYASLFQYIMLREGIECIIVLGTGITQPDAKTGKINHAWNKVKLDGKWYNMDVCWADTANTSDYDLKTDAEYLALPNKHWPTYFGNGPYAAK